jgi:hypothetical protein
MRTLQHTFLLMVLTLVVGCGVVNAQSAPAVSVANDSTKPATNLIDATNQYKANSEELLSIQEREVSEATAKLDELRKLVEEGLVARAELEAAEQQLAGLREQVEATQKQVAASDSQLAEIQAQQNLASVPAAKRLVKLVSKSYPTLGGGTIIRSSGFAGWSLAQLSVVQSFFSSAFGRALPTSAIGQSPTHNRLGYDHRNAVDVGVHPDSAEGRRLISYLQGQGIPFLAFRAAIPGVATGPHIHIGSPSHRL